MLGRRGFLKLATLAGVGLAVPPSFVVVERTLPTDATLTQIDAWLAANSVKPNSMLFLSEDAYRLLRNYYDEQVIR